MTYIITSCLFMIFLLCLWVEIFSKNRFWSIPFISFVSMYYLFFYGIFPIWTANFQAHPVYPTTVGGWTAFFIITFLSAQIIGYLIGMKILPRLFVGNTEYPGDEIIQERSGIDLTGASIILATLCIGFHFCFVLFPELGSVPSVNQIKTPVWNFGFAILIWNAFKLRYFNRYSIVNSALIFVSFFLYAVEITLNGLMTQLFIALIIFLSCAFIWRRFKLVVGAAGMLLVLFLSYGYVKYASKTLYRGEPANIFAFEPDLSVGSVFASINAITRRSAHAFVLEKVITKTPSEIPFAEYSPLLDAARNHVPRIFWRNKPQEKLGNWFGLRYGFLNEGDKTTSWNLPWISEFYLTNGYTKSVLVSFVIGIIFSILVFFLSSIRHRFIGFAVFSSAVLPLFYQESNFSVMTGNLGLMYGFFLFGACFYLYLYKKLVVSCAIGLAPIGSDGSDSKR